MRKFGDSASYQIRSIERNYLVFNGIVCYIYHIIIVPSAIGKGA